jgi:hypothetical protein
MRRALSAVPLLAVLALTLTLAGCAPTPPGGAAPRPPATGSPTPGPAPTATASPEEEPEGDPLDTVTRILLLTDHVWFGDELGWAVDGFRYDQPTADAVAKLTEVFGVDPVAERIDDGEYVSESYEWEGFMLYSSSSAGVSHGIGVYVEVASVHGVTVETADGVHVGTSWADAVRLADSVREGWGETVDPIWEARFDAIPTGTPYEFRAIIAFGNLGGTGPVHSLTGPITTGELPGS